MSDHSELVAEMALLEKMTTQERLKLARKRRLEQLKRWNQRDKEYVSKRKRQSEAQRQASNSRRAANFKVHFVPSVMLLEAAARNDVEEVGRLLMLGVSPDSTNEDGLTALHQCCIDDSEQMMKLLIDFGANVNAKDSELWTPLHAAATCGHRHLVKYLIDKGADLLAVNADGNMPYDICEDEMTLDLIESEMAKRGITQEMIDETRAATEREMLSHLKMIAQKGGDLEFRDSVGATPLHVAAANGYLSVAEFLLDNHVSTDARDADDWQPIHAAACWGHLEIMELLVQSGADLEAKTKNGETPFDICEDPEIRERIIELKNEMDMKRGTHGNRLRRTQSSNTRSHSVRRTSIREKVQISRREAREEATLRLKQEEQLQRDGTDEETGGDEFKQTLDTHTSEKSSINDNHTSRHRGSSNSTSQLHNRQSPNSLSSNHCSSSYSNGPSQSKIDSNPVLDINSVGLTIDSHQNGKESTGLSKDLVKNPSQAPSYPNDLPPESHKNEAVVIRNNGYSEKDTKTNNGTMGNSGSNANSFDGSQSQQPSNRNSTESVKVEIHVTVNTSQATSYSGTGTLAELKKTRSDLRHRNSIGSAGSSGAESSGYKSSSVTMANSALTNNAGNNSHSVNATYLYQGVPRPSSTSPQAVRKFRAASAEVIGDNEKKGCCIII